MKKHGCKAASLANSAEPPLQPCHRLAGTQAGTPAHCVFNTQMGEISSHALIAECQKAAVQSINKQTESRPPRDASQPGLPHHPAHTPRKPCCLRHLLKFANACRLHKHCPQIPILANEKYSSFPQPRRQRKGRDTLNTFCIEHAACRRGNYCFLQLTTLLLTSTPLALQCMFVPGLRYRSVGWTLSQGSVNMAVPQAKGALSQMYKGAGPQASQV